MKNRKELLRGIPKIDEMLIAEQLVFLLDKHPRAVVVEELRKITENIRKGILSGEQDHVPSIEEIIERVKKNVTTEDRYSLRRVVNGTGVVLHTNLGRANLSPKTVEHLAEIAGHYSTCEYDLEKGGRGSRHDHVEEIIKQITGAEAAMIVNNNAAATMIVLAALAKDKEVVVSRGELVEIGGSFRIPEIMEQSGAILKEVGATNKTHIKDYITAYDEERTAAFLKVHTSNYRMVGFTKEVELPELVELGKKCNVPVIYDMGSGLIADLSRYGVDEPNVTAAMATGIDLILFSGDKLLGGPQAGILAGKKKYIDIMKGHPLARAFRVDKMTLAAAEDTFRQYLDSREVLKENPVLKMITVSKEELWEKAEKLKQALTKKAGGFEYSIVPCEDSVGGGSAPTTVLHGYAVEVDLKGIPVQKAETMLRKAELPMIVRIFHDRIRIHVRTVDMGEIPAIGQNFSQIKKLTEGGK